MGVSKNRGIPNWMVYNGTPYFLMDDLGVPLFSGGKVRFQSSTQKVPGGCYTQKPRMLAIGATWILHFIHF